MVSWFFRSAFATPFVFLFHGLAGRSRPWESIPPLTLMLIICCLGGLSVFPKVKDWFVLATSWAAVFQRLQFLVLFSIFFLELLFKKFWIYPFEDHGGSFRSFYLRGTLLAMVGSRGSSAIASIAMLLQDSGNAARPGQVLGLHPCVNSCFSACCYVSGASLRWCRTALVRYVGLPH